MSELKDWLEDNGWLVLEGVSEEIGALKNGRYIEVWNEASDWEKTLNAYGGQFIVAKTVEDLEAQLVPPRCQVVAEGR